MSKKRLTTDNISNPLEESAFFREQPLPVQPAPAKQVENKEPAAQEVEKPAPQSTRRKAGRPKTKFKTSRQSYEIYTYQTRALRKLSAQAQLETGRKTSLSELVREAVDMLLEKKGVNIPNK